MAQEHQHPNPMQQMAQPEPGFFSIVKDTIKRGFQLAVTGAIMGAVAGVIAHFCHLDVVNFFQNTLKLGSVGTANTIGGALGTGAVVGAITGAVVGVPTGCYSAVCKMKSYYHNVALPREHEIGKSEGVQLGAQLEHSAMEHEIQSKQYRDTIAKRSNQYADQAVVDKQNQNSQVMMP